LELARFYLSEDGGRAWLKVAGLLPARNLGAGSHFLSKYPMPIWRIIRWCVGSQIFILAKLFVKLNTQQNRENNLCHDLLTHLPLSSHSPGTTDWFDFRTLVHIVHITIFLGLNTPIERKPLAMGPQGTGSGTGGCMFQKPERRTDRIPAIAPLRGRLEVGGGGKEWMRVCDFIGAMWLSRFTPF